jgi:hypothetical protein
VWPGQEFLAIKGRYAKTLKQEESLNVEGSCTIDGTKVLQPRCSVHKHLATWSSL